MAARVCHGKPLHALFERRTHVGPIWRSAGRLGPAPPDRTVL